MTSIQPTVKVTAQETKKKVITTLSRLSSQRECSDLLTAMNELTAGPYAPSEKEWQWMEDVMGMPTRESLMALFDKVDDFQEGDLRSSK